MYQRKNVRYHQMRRQGRRRRPRNRMKLLIFPIVLTLLFFCYTIYGFFKQPLIFGADLVETTAPVEPEPETLVEEPAKAEGEILVVIDPGHGGNDPGCIWNDQEEKDINLAIALLLEPLLVERGIRPVLARRSDSYMAVEDRAAYANRLGADLYISIHQNADDDTKIHGIETLYGTAEGSEQLGQFVQEALAGSLGGRDRGSISGAELVVLNQTQMPSCLVECGYLSNPQERALLTDQAVQQQIAESLEEGIVSYLEALKVQQEAAAYDGKIMKLTFDDGPRWDTTPQILDILKTRGIKATFFLVGGNVEKNPELAKRIVDEGHAIGIHCYDHEYETLYQSVETYVADFNKASDIIEAATGVRPKIFRFPGGSINSYNKPIYAEIITEMERWGYVYFDWNASLEDAVGGATAKSIIEQAGSTAAPFDYVVMLAHDTVAITAENLEGVLDLFGEYRFEEIKDGDRPIQFRR